MLPVQYVHMLLLLLLPWNEVDYKLCNATTQAKVVTFARTNIHKDLQCSVESLSVSLSLLCIFLENLHFLPLCSREGIWIRIFYLLEMTQERRRTEKGLRKQYPHISGLDIIQEVLLPLQRKNLGLIYWGNSRRMQFLLRCYFYLALAASRGSAFYLPGRMTTSPDDNQGASPRGFSPFKAREKRIVAENAAFRSRDTASSCFLASSEVKEKKRETNYGRLLLSFLLLAQPKSQQQFCCM